MYITYALVTNKIGFEKLDPSDVWQFSLKIIEKQIIRFIFLSNKLTVLALTVIQLSVYHFIISSGCKY